MTTKDKDKDNDDYTWLDESRPSTYVSGGMHVWQKEIKDLWWICENQAKTAFMDDSKWRLAQRRLEKISKEYEKIIEVIRVLQGEKDRLYKEIETMRKDDVVSKL